MFLKDFDLLKQVKDYLDRTRDENRITANYLFSPIQDAVYPFVIIVIDTSEQSVEEIDYSGDEEITLNLEIHCPLDKAHETDGRNTNLERLIYATDALRKQVMKQSFIENLRVGLQSSTLRVGGVNRQYGTLEAGGKKFITSTISIPIVNFNSYDQD